VEYGGIGNFLWTECDYAVWEVLDFTAKHFLHVLSPASQCDDAIGNPKPVGNLPRSLKWTEVSGDWNNEDPTKPETLKARTLQPNPGWKWLRPGSCQRRIMGSCLPSLLQLAGTKYFPDFTEKSSCLKRLRERARIN